MKNVTFHEDARAEMAEVAHYYEDRVPGLGHAFADDVERSLKEITENPEAFGQVSNNLRRKLVSRFPYGLIYSVEQDCIKILAIAHHKRRPEYWRYRLK